MLKTSASENKYLLTVSTEQAVILQPLGEKGIAIVGGDMIRGFSTADQVCFIMLKVFPISGVY